MKTELLVFGILVLFIGLGLCQLGVEEEHAAERVEEKYRSSGQFDDDIGVSQRLQTLGIGVAMVGGIMSLAGSLAPSNTGGAGDQDAIGSEDGGRPAPKTLRSVLAYFVGCGIVAWIAVNVVHNGLLSFFVFYAIGISIAALVAKGTLCTG